MVRKFLKKLKSYLKIGLSPHKIALAASLGIFIGLSPLLGLTTIICATLAFVFRLNMGIIQAANYLVYPLQLILMFPFMLTGTRLFDPKQLVDPAMIKEFGALPFWEVLGMLGNWYLYGTLIWLITALPVAFLIYRILLRILNRHQEKKEKQKIVRDI